MTERFYIRLPSDEARLLRKWGAAKGCTTMTDLLRFLAEPAMNRSKVSDENGDLHEQLIECRLRDSENAKNRRTDRQTTKSRPDASKSTDTPCAVVRGGNFDDSGDVE